MTTATESPALATPAWMLWTGRVLSALPILGLVMSAAMKLAHRPDFVAKWVGHLGFPERTLSNVGLLELVCVAIYAIPRTSTLGALLLTGYLGGAAATHVRIGEPVVTPVLIGVFVWAGLFLRDARLRALLPLRSPSAGFAPAASTA